MAKGICFKEPLFLATIEARKTQTRRIMKPQPKDCSEGHKNFEGAEWRNEPMDLVPDIFPGHEDEWEGGFVCRLCGNGLDWLSGKGLYKPRYKVGEIVALKESYFDSWDECAWEEERKYKEFECIDDLVSSPGWSNKMLTKSEHMRYFIKITAVRAERLQDISDDDCWREGILSLPDNYGNPSGYYGVGRGYDRPIDLGTTWKEAYAALIDKIDGKGTWESNPFVWIYDYELTEKPE